MPTPKARWTEEALAILADGEWHSLTELTARAGKHIPPGRAVREREQDRIRQKARNPAAAYHYDMPITVEAQVATGRRRMIAQALDSRVNTGALHKERRTGEVGYTLTPLTGDGGRRRLSLTGKRKARIHRALVELLACKETTDQDARLIGDLILSLARKP